MKIRDGFFPTLAMDQILWSVWPISYGINMDFWKGFIGLKGYFKGT